MHKHCSLDLTYTKYIKPHRFTPLFNIHRLLTSLKPFHLLTYMYMRSVHPRKPTRIFYASRKRLRSQIQRNTFGKTLRINNNEYYMRLFAYVRECESFKHLLKIIPTYMGVEFLKDFEL